MISHNHRQLNVQQTLAPPGDNVPGDNGDSGGGGTPPTDGGNPPNSGDNPPNSGESPPTETDNPVSGDGSLQAASGGTPVGVLAELAGARDTGLVQSAMPNALAFTGASIQRLVGLALALIVSGLLLTLRRRRSSSVQRW